MKKLILILFALWTCTCCYTQSVPAAASGQKEAAKKVDVATILDRRLSNLEQEVVPAAEAMPEDKFNFAPGDTIKSGEFKDVKTFALQVRHIAATNQLIAASLLGEKSPLSTEESDLGPKAMTSKAEIIAYLKDSFVKLHRGMALSTAQNLTEQVRSPFEPGQASRLGIIIIALAHTYDHYGQMVEYLRMNNIIPPASRPAK